ncbi:MAG: ergothioneine biosynthesis protein EgtB [Bdellovibrionales bacterium]|nr:ergothioneine biosynthesis protein EgtB [Bdellovibrionales bacterium]
MKEATATSVSLLEDFQKTRALSLAIVEPLDPDDFNVAPIPEASPLKWHLAHTTWFFETFILMAEAKHDAFHPQFGYLFNSYYKGLGDHLDRNRRVHLSRPNLKSVMQYRKDCDEKMAHLLGKQLPKLDPQSQNRILSNLEVGIHHEMQHQELLITDLKSILGLQPLLPSYFKNSSPRNADPRSSLTRKWVRFEGALIETGFSGKGFHFDNEAPRYSNWVAPFEMSSTWVRNGEYLEFLKSKAYADPRKWLSDGWDRRPVAPMYWDLKNKSVYTLNGPVSMADPLWLDSPVSHVSYFEADAYCRTHGARLPTENEWELAATSNQVSRTQKHFLDVAPSEPQSVGSTDVDRPLEITGQVWEWTQSAYLPYPGFKPQDGALGEYNGKFMINQMVLRGGSVATPRNHFRPTYRNFFPPATQWQFSGFRLARSIDAPTDRGQK